jgi:hypothetical protein
MKICPWCKLPKEAFIKIYRNNKEIFICMDCEGKIVRPFMVNVESKVARSFIDAVKSQGLFVKETIIRLMRDFISRSKGVENGNGSHRLGVSGIPEEPPGPRKVDRCSLLHKD